MKSPEEIKYTLHWCWNRETNNQCIECPYKNEDCGRALETDALAYIQQLEQRLVEANETSPRWISVMERLPEKGDPVVALCHYEFAPDKYYIMSERYTPYSNMWLDGSVRYWIPLPPLPPVPREEEHE